MRKKQGRSRGWRELENDELKSIQKEGKKSSFIFSAFRTHAL